MDDLQTGELICPMPETYIAATALSGIIRRQTGLRTAFDPKALVLGWDGGDWQRQLEEFWRCYFAQNDKEEITVKWTIYKLES